MSTKPPSSRTPAALVASYAFGAVGGVLLLAGLVSGENALAVAGAGGGALSLGAALLWRSQLVEAWHSERRRAPASSKGDG